MLRHGTLEGCSHGHTIATSDSQGGWACFESLQLMEFFVQYSTNQMPREFQRGLTEQKSWNVTFLMQTIFE
jgi:hypothetical protein